MTGVFQSTNAPVRQMHLRVQYDADRRRHYCLGLRGFEFGATSDSKARVM
jgi:hypothetical protein